MCRSKTARFAPVATARLAQPLAVTLPLLLLLVSKAAVASASAWAHAPLPPRGMACVLEGQDAACAMPRPGAAAPTAAAGMSWADELVGGGTPGTPPPAADLRFTIAVPATQRLGLELSHHMRVLSAARVPPGPLQALRPGDQLLAVDGAAVVGMSLERVAALVRPASDAARVRLLTFLPGDGRPRPLPTPRDFEFDVVLRGARGSGLRLAPDLTVLGFKPLRSGAESPVGATGLVREGDKLIALNGHTLHRVPLPRAKQLLREAFAEHVVRCRGGSVTRYCSMERAQHADSPVTLRFRPPTVGSRDASDASDAGDTEAFATAAAQAAMAAPLAESAMTTAASQSGTASTAAAAAAAAAAVTHAHSGRLVLGVHSRFSNGSEGTTVALTVPYMRAEFGGPVPCPPRPLLLAQPPMACGELQQRDEEVRGSAVLVRRGACFLASKARAAQYAGARLVIVSNVDTGPAGERLFRMPAGDEAVHDLTLGAVLVATKAGQALERLLKDTAAMAAAAAAAAAAKAAANADAGDVLADAVVAEEPPARAALEDAAAASSALVPHGGASATALPPAAAAALGSSTGGEEEACLVSATVLVWVQPLAGGECGVPDSI